MINYYCSAGEDSRSWEESEYMVDAVERRETKK